MTSISGPLAAHVGQEGHLARPLDRDRDLALVAPAGAGDPAGADLPLLGDVPPQLVVVLVVDLLDLLLAEVAALPADRAGRRARALAAGLLSRRAPPNRSSPSAGARAYAPV